MNYKNTSPHIKILVKIYFHPFHPTEKNFCVRPWLETILSEFTRAVLTVLTEFRESVNVHLVQNDDREKIKGLLCD